MSAFLDSALTPEQLAAARAADAQQFAWERARRIDLPAASAAHVALGNALQACGSRFAETSCSQCGCGLGPGDSGVSSCVDHIRLLRPMVKSISPAYAEFRSEFLGGDVRIGYEWYDAEEHAHYPQLAGAEINEILAGGIDWTQKLDSMTISVLEAELREHLAARAAL